ncbi:uncharacterized protein ccdc180, partial [Austrofundulus limnaeus]|uniref:Uncharacterized protein ccdc180 n=1 Tax=Austrofundulus limnaeus TaxID=52670 RepID=A0A2I4D172_AUSLI
MEAPSGRNRQVFRTQTNRSCSSSDWTAESKTGRGDTRTAGVSSEDSNRTISRRKQLAGDDDDVIADVIRLPDSVETNHPPSNITDELKKKSEKHDEALKQLETHLTHLSQEVFGLWEEVEEVMKMKKTRVSELDLKLSDCEKRRVDEIRVLLRKHLLLLEEISFLPPPDLQRLIHTETQVLNQSLLANRRSVALLLLHLQEEILQQETFLLLQWEQSLNLWRSSRIHETVDQIRALCSSDEDLQLVSDQQNQIQLALTEERCDIIRKICSLVPPTCSSAVVSDWFSELTSINQQIDRLHEDLLHQLTGVHLQRCQNQQAAVERCQVALSALQVSDQQVDDIISSQVLPLIGQKQSQDEEQVAALDQVCRHSVSRHAVSISRCVFAVMQAAAMIWETHCCRWKRREEELQQHLDDIRQTQQQHIQRKTVRVDALLEGLRQESSEDALKTSLDRTVLSLKDIEDSCRQCVSGQWEVLDHFPSLFMEDLVSYSRNICSFFRLSHAYLPVTMETTISHTHTRS